MQAFEGLRLAGRKVRRPDLTFATVDHIAKGRLCINIISSDMPGLKESNEVRYARASEIIQILQALWRTDGAFEWKGEFYNISLATTEPAKPYQQNGGPLMYFGGISPAAQERLVLENDERWPLAEVLPLAEAIALALVFLGLGAWLALRGNGEARIGCSHEDRVRVASYVPGDDS